MNINFGGIMNGIFGRIDPDMCRLTMSGKIAIYTSNGYKAYDIKKNRLTNCDSFVFNVGQDMFFVIPTNHVVRGDIILVNGKPRVVLEVGKNEIKTFCYEDSTISTIVPEHHIFMGKQYFYGKIVSMFGNLDGGKSKGMDRIVKYMMMSEMMRGNGFDPRIRETGGMENILPMMFMMSGGNFFDGMFDFDSDDDDEEEEEDESDE